MKRRTRTRTSRTSRDTGRLRYPNDDFPIALAIGGIGALGLLYLALKPKKAAAALPPAPVAPPGPNPLPAPPPPGVDRASVRARYQQYQDQLGLPGGADAYRGHDAILVQLANDLDAVGDPVGALDVRRTLAQIV